MLLTIYRCYVTVEHGRQVINNPINPLTPRVKPWVIQSFLTFDSMESVTIHWKAVEQCFTVVLFANPLIQSFLTLDSLDRTPKV